MPSRPAVPNLREPYTPVRLLGVVGELLTRGR
jgi:hypothetical protein